VSFATLEYALFLAATVVAYWLVPAAAAPFVLAGASVVFYASWSAAYLALIAAAVTIAWGGGRAVRHARLHGRSQRLPLVVSVTALLGLLAFFKYARFTLSLVHQVFGVAVPAVQVTLPLGISFYTFQLLGYVIDVGRGGPVERWPHRLALFVGFFPHLIAGPIVRASELIPQLVRRLPFDGARAMAGLELIAFGLVKKMVVADNLAAYVTPVFAQPGDAAGLDVVCAVLAFGAQIYCDFSGYTDIARGSARLMGIELPLNFLGPYRAVTLTDFWRRWHMTLSRWLRDYLYVSLGGNRRGQTRTVVNLFLTMALGGLWHGANLTFVAWGAYHGLLLAAERLSGAREAPTAPGRRLARAALTFALVQVGWAIFRADDFGALAVLAGRLLADPVGLAPRMRTAVFLPLWVGAYLAHWIAPTVAARLSPRPDRRLRPLAAGAWLAAATVLVLVFGDAQATFIYFQF
jgi:D-alanyl-lipoteichoic acid acyltransferase DltB (MBOAT superfamily)